MHDQPENKDFLKPKDAATTKTTSSSDKIDETKYTNPSDPSSSRISAEADKANVNGDIIPTDSSSKQEEKLQSNIVLSERPGTTHGEILVNEKTETTKRKTFKLPTDTERNIPSSQQDVVGDDFSRKNEVHIACECQPNVAGAAVPTVKSFTPMEKDDAASRSSRSNSHLPDQNESEKPQQSIPTTHKSKDKARTVSKIGQLIKDGEREKLYSDISKKVKTFSPDNQYHKNVSKKPSLIPKPTKLNVTNGRTDKEETEKREHGQSRVRLEQQKSHSNSGTRVKEIKPPNTCSIRITPKSVASVPDKVSEGSDVDIQDISSRMLSLQERLQATTSMLRQKIQTDKVKEKVLPECKPTDLVDKDEINKESASSLSNINTLDDLYKSIFSLKEAASALLENNTMKSQRKYIEKLFRHISEIKLIADKLGTPDSPDNDNFGKEKSLKPSVVTSKDNKIYIKFMRAKDRRSDSKKKIKDSAAEQSDDQNDALASKAPSESDTGLEEKNQEENKVKEADSMDGVFIPSCEPPINMEDEEEPNGLDITITFPEFSQLYSNFSESHLSVCLSDISEEALKKLKRCPKDFTLRMDFVEGKVLFQSGKGPTNNFQIGPDLKFSENVIDSKKSDVISIKPSTECSFRSQLIPVESPKEIKSFKSLKSADSELFNVVSLPFLYPNRYLGTSHKSCITFRNNQIMSMALLAKHIFKSMPQIPSLTNIFEDKFMGSPSKTASQIQEKRRRNRLNQRKWTSASSVI